jgi:predicted nucleotidyltransferase
VPTHKDRFLRILGDFREQAGQPGPVLLLALRELTGQLDGSGREIDLSLLVRTASIRAAEHHPEQPLDQGGARKRYWILFERLQAAKLGRATKGRRNHRTRFRVASGGVDGKPSAFVGAMDELTGRAKLRPPAPVSERGEPRAPLRLQDVIGRLKLHSDELHQLGVSALSLFGSVARDEAGPDSDVDLLATFESPVTSDAFFGAKFFLEDLLGKRIDLVTESALRDPIREAIGSELIRVA